MMTFIAEGGARTVTNCSVFDMRKVYQVVVNAVIDVCASHPGGEVHRTGETVNEQIVYHIIADTDELARALYEKKWGSTYQRHTLISIAPLFCIDGEISYRHK